MAHLAAVLGALGAPLVLVSRRRAAIFAGLATIAAAEAVLAASGPNGVSPARAALGVVGLAGLALFVALFVRRPELVTLAILVAAPLRLPFDFGAGHRFFVGLAQNGETGRLLPLYGLLAAAGLALVWRLVREPDREVPALPAEIALPLGALASFAALSVLWSSADAAAQNLLQYFLLPFVVLVAVVARSPFPAWMPRALGIASVALAGLFVTVGLIEEATQRLIFYTPSVQIGNAYSSFFRVTSLFRDPSVYGRHVVLALAVVLTLAWYRKIGMAVAALLVAFLFAGLLFSYSQSSLVALFCVAVFISVVAGDRAVRIAAAVTAVLVIAGGGAFVADKVAGASTQRVTSDRSRRVTLTAKVFANHPFLGVGLGSQPRASQAASSNGGPPTLFVSHTTPLTIGAELGLVGLALYAALLAGSARALLRVFRIEAAFGLALAAVFVALFIHSLLYSRVLRGSDHLARARRRVELPRGAGGDSAGRVSDVSGSGIDRRAAFGVLGVLGALVAVNVPSLGSDSWPFRTPPRLRSRPARSPRARRRRALGPRCGANARRPRRRARRGPRSRRLAGRVVAPAASSLPPASPSSCWSRFRPPCSRSGCGTVRRPGSTRTTRRTRSSWRAGSCDTGIPPTATTTRAPASSGSTVATAVCRPRPCIPRWRWRTSPTSPARR